MTKPMMDLGELYESEGRARQRFERRPAAKASSQHIEYFGLPAPAVRPSPRLSGRGSCVPPAFRRRHGFRQARRDKKRRWQVRL